MTARKTRPPRRAEASTPPPSPVEELAFYRRLVDQANDAILMLDPTSEDILEANPKACEMYGFDRQELLELSMKKLTQDVARGEHQISRILEEHQTYNFETVHYRKDGSTLDILVSASVIPFRGRDAILVINRDVSDRRSMERKLQHSLSMLRQAMGGVIRAMALTVERRDPYTAGHQRRVSDLARAIGRKMGLNSDTVDGIRMAGAIHDLGKISIPAELLSKPGRLSEMEFDLIKTHSAVGYDILKTIEFPWPVAEMVLQHHERIDGSGYPNRLSGDEILVGARVLSVVDVVEAMASHRPYRPSLGVRVAMDEITKNSGRLYDPEVVKACLDLFESGYSFQQ